MRPVLIALIVLGGLGLLWVLFQMAQPAPVYYGAGVGLNGQPKSTAQRVGGGVLAGLGYGLGGPVGGLAGGSFASAVGL